MKYRTNGSAIWICGKGWSGSVEEVEEVCCVLQDAVAWHLLVEDVVPDIAWISVEDRD